MRLEELPVDAVAHILSFLDWKNLLVVSNLSRFLREVYQSFPKLQFSYAMQTYGMIDTDPTRSVRCKLSEIERRERAWRELDPSHEVTIKVPHQTSHIYKLPGGIYLRGDGKNSLDSHDTQTLRFFDLSTCTSRTAVREEPCLEMRFETKIVDVAFGLDEFDLVAVVGINPPRNEEQGSIVLSFRELSTGAPHPLAKHPDIFVDPVHGHEGKLSIMMEIVGPSLLLLLTWRTRRRSTRPRDKLLLFNWWEGRKVAAETAPPSTWSGFVFLSPELILLPNHNHTLEIARLPDVSKTCYSSIGFERVIILELSALRPRVKVDKVRCRSKPNPRGAVHPRTAEIGSGNTEHTRRKQCSPMSSDPTKAIVLLKWYYSEYLEDEYDRDVLRHKVSLILRRQFLLDFTGTFERASDLADALKRCDRGKKLGAPFWPWGLWNMNARWQVDDSHITNRITNRIMTSAGQRHIGFDEEGHLIVRDYNPYSFRCACAVQRPGYFADAEQLEGGTGDEGGTEEMPGHRTDDEDDLDLETDSSTDDGTQSPGSCHPGIDEASVQRVLEIKLSTPPPSSEVNTGPPTGDDSPSCSSNSSIASTLFLAPPASASSSSPTSSDPSEHSPFSNSPPSPNPGEDTTWQRVRIIEGYDETEEYDLCQLFEEDCSFPLECVEYVSKKTYYYDGLLMDEERIIGLRHDENLTAVEFDVLTI